MRILLMLILVTEVVHAEGVGKELGGAGLNLVGSALVTSAIVAASQHDDTCASCRDVPSSLLAMSLGVSGAVVLLIGIPLEVWGANQRRRTQGKKPWFLPSLSRFPEGVEP
jgi:hypothetical protein